MTLNNNNKTSRDSNIELLRIVLMLMIIGFHLIVHGAQMGGPIGDHVITDSSSVAYVFLKSFLIIAVNCFVFISGFYRIKFKIKTLLSLFFQAVFYSVAINLAVDLLSLEYISYKMYIKAMFAAFSGIWWFLTAYLGLYLLSPLLNNAIDTFNKHQFLFILISVTLINSVSGFMFGAGPIVGTNSGFSLISFVHIYLIAQYISKYVNLDKLTKYSPAVYVVSSLTVFLLAIFSITQMSQTGIGKIYAYNNPLVLIAAVSFFFFFKNLRFRSSFVNSISPYVLGVYLFHDHPLTRKYLIENLFNLSQHRSVWLHFFSLLLITVLVFFAGFIIDKIREIILTPVTQRIIQKFNLARVERVFSMKPS
ncbi:hypothetical protein DXT99_11585 [Pontibacter diazotrophicus]|uniref:Acyltransferase 3 domain-containing protein n=1 Tax=Pontibacter diazotrophicus TaxID=1400979 RepID=A0A3D8LC02_9BACT|nr:acyltransferase family protein [Pontibacter diazotrophicus]RDV14925.1 hypothetical protein DXT99_11585 [Pontibacter diazotrophicus]